MPGKNVFVVKDGDDWSVRRENAGRASSRHTTQHAAIEHGQEIAKRLHGELRIQGRDGKFRDSDSYGHDPHPPRD
jgi:hypothetical protein